MEFVVVSPYNWACFLFPIGGTMIITVYECGHVFRLGALHLQKSIQNYKENDCKTLIVILILHLPKSNITESALLRVFNDILWVNDSGDYAILVLLDQTAAFDTVDHNILVARLRHLVGICGSALDWFMSYLADRTLCISLGGSESCSADIWDSTGFNIGTPAFLPVFAASGFHFEEAWHFLSLLC